MYSDDITVKTNLSASWLQKYKEKVVSAEEAVKVIKSGDKMVIQPGCSCPNELVRAMVDRKDDLSDVEIYHILITGELPYVQPGMEKHFKHKAFFIGGNSRKAVN